MTTMSSVPFQASFPSIMATPMAGWTMALRSATVDGSANATSASLGRSMRPSASRIPGPNRSTSAWWAGAPGLDHLAGHLVGVHQVGPVGHEELGHGRLAGADVAGESDGQHARAPRAGHAGRRGREAVANSTIVVRSRSSVTKKSSAEIPVTPPESPRAITL